jgi:hypothetical protein
MNAPARPIKAAAPGAGTGTVFVKLSIVKLVVDPSPVVAVVLAISKATRPMALQSMGPAVGTKLALLKVTVPFPEAVTATRPSSGCTDWVASYAPKTKRVKVRPVPAQDPTLTEKPGVLDISRVEPDGSKVEDESK